MPLSKIIVKRNKFFQFLSLLAWYYMKNDYLSKKLDCLETRRIFKCVINVLAYHCKFTEKMPKFCRIVSLLRVERQLSTSNLYLMISILFYKFILVNQGTASISIKATTTIVNKATTTAATDQLNYFFLTIILIKIKIVNRNNKNKNSNNNNNRTI